MIKSHYLFVIFLILSGSYSYSQLEAANWYFGFNAGLNFDPITGDVTPLTNGAMRTNEGCASISDSDGNLLFYTDGSNVYNRNHTLMDQGFGLLGNASSTQSAIIIPKPQDPDIYYIFTVDTGVAGGGQDAGLNYYEVDMTGDSGLGSVTTDFRNPNNLLPVCSEKITAINDPVNDDILIIVYGTDGTTADFNTFFTFRVTAAGVQNTPIASPQLTSSRDRRGYLKLSPDGQFLVNCNFGDPSYIYDYDRATGIASNERELIFPAPNSSAYGIEYSPNSSLLYITTANSAGGGSVSTFTTSLYQFDLNAANIPASRLELDSRPGYRGALQLGIDGKIYRALANSFTEGARFLGRINNPDVRGNGANYEHNAVDLNGRLSAQGLPPFIQSFFALIEVENLCSGDTTLFTFETDNIPTAVEWEFGDGNTSTDLSASHVYASPGTYDIVLRITVGAVTRIYRKSITISQTPVINDLSNIIACDQNLDGEVSFDLVDTTQEILGSQDPAIFSVSYFESMTDANSNANPISLPYLVDVPQMTLFARIDNQNNNECYEVRSFDINIYPQPVANPVDALRVCDDNFDGIETFNLNTQNADLLLDQDPFVFNISYHSTEADAIDGINPLNTTYRNTNPFTETIYARVENNVEDSCVATTSFDLIVEERPQAFDFTGFQCDEDGVADSLTNFNLSSFDASIAGTTTGIEVTYYIDQANANLGTNPLDSRNYRNLTPTQTLIARVTNTNTGCFNTATLTLSVSASDAQDATLELCDDDGIQDGLRLFNLREADDAVLTSAPADVTVNYYATLENALAEQQTLSDEFTNTVANQQIIYARAESPDGNCFGISEVTLIVNGLPQLVPEDFLEYCGNDPQPLTLDAGPVSGSINDYTYLWNTGETTYSIQVRDGGIYTVVVSNSNNCSESREITVVISEPATVNSIDVINANGGATGEATAVVSGLGDYEYRIDINAGFQDSPNFSNLDPGFYTMYVNDKNGCGETTANFSIVGYPNFFTPNGDGFNDLWQLNGVNAMFEPEAKIYIFDRFGKLLKQLTPSSPGWDGTFNGEPLPSTDYWFKATLTDGTEFSSNFSLKR